MGNIFTGLKPFISTWSRPLVWLLLAANFVCLIIGASNITPLYGLAVVAVAGAVIDSPRRYISWYTVVFAAFIIYIALCECFLFNDATSFAFRRRAGLAFLAGIAIFQTTRSEAPFFSCQLTVLLPVISGAVLAWYYLAPATYELFIWGRLKLLTIHPNLYAMQCAVAFISGLAFLVSSKGVGCVGPEFGARWHYRPRLRFVAKCLSAFMAAASFVLLFMTLSRTSVFASFFIGAGMFLYWLLFMLDKKKCMRFFVISVAVCVAAFFVVDRGDFRIPNASRVLHAAIAPWEAATVKSRFPLWEIGWNSFLDKPLFGHGPESFSEYTRKFVHDNFTELSAEYGAQLLNDDTLKVENAHNQYLMLLSENGAIGFLLFLPLLLCPFIYSIRYRRLYGVIVPLLSYYAICFFFESPLVGNKAVAFSTTIFFMLIGYFSCLVGKAPFNEQ